MEGKTNTTMKVREEAYLRHLKLFKYPQPNKVDGDTGNLLQNQHQHQAAFMIKFHDMEFKGLPSTKSESIELSVKGIGFPVKNFDDYTQKHLAMSLVLFSNLQEASAKALACEINTFVASCFRFDEDDESRHNFFYLFVVYVSRRLVSSEYWEAKTSLVKHYHDSVVVDDRHDNVLMNEGYTNFEKIQYAKDQEDIPELLRLWQGVPDLVKPTDLVEVKPALELMIAMYDGRDMDKQLLIMDEKQKPWLCECKKGECECECECSICLRPLAGKVLESSESSDVFAWLPKPHSCQVVRLKCGHAFHYRCIFNWLPWKQSCPYCRSTSLTYV